GTHLVECNDGMLAYCYGIGFYESYLYLAGFNLPNFDLDFKDSVLQYDCQNQKINMQFRAISSKTLKSYTWYFGDNTSGTGSPVTHLYDTLGMLTVKLVGEDFSGKKDSVTKKIKVDWPVFDPVRNKIICGIDTVTFIEKNPFFDNFKWQDSSTNNYYKAWSNKNIWVYATDTSGYCQFVDSGVVSKIEIFNNIFVDSIDKCHETNLYRFKETTSVVADQIYHRAWVFPFTTVWDTSDFTIKFPMPGKYKVYYDIYTLQENCKARYPIDVVVHPNPRAYTNQYGDFYCSGSDVFFKDSSQIVTGHIDSVKWIFDDNVIQVSDSSKTYKKFQYNPSNGNVTRNFYQISYSDHQCTDTVYSAVNIWPSPVSGFSISTPDTIKCLPAARWTFSSTTTAYYDSFTLNWDAGNGITSKAKDMKNIRYNTTGIFKVKLVATSDQFGCIDSTIKYVEVLKLPVAGIWIPDTIQCLNSNLFYVQDTSEGKYLKQKWTIDSLTTDSGKVLDSLHFNTIGIHKIKLEVSNNYASCVDITERNVMVTAPPSAQFISNKDTQCLNGNQFIFTNNSTFNQPYKSSEWFYESSSSSIRDTNYTPPNYVAIDTGNIKISLIVEDNENCKDTVIKNIRIESQVKSPISINDDIQCQDSNRFIFKTVIGPNETRKWKVDNQVVSTGVKDSLVLEINTSGQHNVTVVGMNAAGCNDSNTINFTVLPILKAGFKINNDTQCLDQQGFQLSDTTVANINQWTYIINDTLIINNANTGSFQFGQAGRYKAQLFIVTDEQCIDTATAYLTVLDNPSISIIGDTVCFGELAAIKGIGSNIKTWKWQLGDGDSSSLQNLNHLYASIGSYNLTLKVSDINNCKNEASAVGAVIINPLPDATFNFDVQDYGINQVRLKFIPFSLSYPNYLWLFPNGETSNLDTPSFIIQDLFKGETKLIVTNQYGCIDSSINYQYVYPNNFNVYIPNAITLNNDLLNDQFKPIGIGATKSYEMHIYNRWGEEIFYTDNKDIAWDGRYQNEFVMQDTYTYYIEFTFIDGKTYRFKGTLTVLR
ncbi:MAG: PKD domain-containing protein, partial [Bacteroidia bacterium]|nr:PKD domain-containing protein [Bacteroidia bacterium]